MGKAGGGGCTPVLASYWKFGLCTWSKVSRSRWPPATATATLSLIEGHPVQQKLLMAHGNLEGPSRGRGTIPGQIRRKLSSLHTLASQHLSATSPSHPLALLRCRHSHLPKFMKPMSGDSMSHRSRIYSLDSLDSPLDNMQAKARLTCLQLRSRVPRSTVHQLSRAPWGAATTLRAFAA